MADVLGIVAGLGGLTSARDLAASGHRVTVLEARKRVGGRIHTDTFSGTSTWVDLGAQWAVIEEDVRAPGFEGAGESPAAGPLDIRQAERIG